MVEPKIGRAASGVPGVGNLGTQKNAVPSCPVSEALRHTPQGT